jgi:hypothetical protein
MNAGATKKPWWKKKRWRLALAVWLWAAYPFSVGPLLLFYRRGWLPDAAATAFDPALLIQYVPALGSYYSAYLHWWYVFPGDVPPPS